MKKRIAPHIRHIRKTGSVAGYHQRAKQQKQDRFTDLNPDTETTRQRDLGSREAERTRLYLLGMHTALNKLQIYFRKAFCKGCSIKTICQGTHCQVAVDIIPRNETGTRIVRPMPQPSRALPLDLGKPSGKKKRLSPHYPGSINFTQIEDA